MNKKDHNKNIINDSTHLFYSDKGLFDNIINSCFLNAWHALGPVDKFIKKGFSPASILKCDNAMPIIVSSHNDTKGLQVLSNSCTHRGHIVTEKCTECVGFYDEPQCAAVCPVDCCLPDEKNKETREDLISKKESLHS